MNNLSDFQTALEFGNSSDKDAGLRKGSEEQLWRRFINDRNKELELDPPTTNPDQAVINILYANGIYQDQLNNYQFRTGLTRQAQNMVGDLLERFLYRNLKDWIWCSGAIVPKIDFLKKTPDEWIKLQIKNGSSSENSSSKAIRDNTDILMWYRVNNRNKTTNWSSLHNIVGYDTNLNEQAFQKYISRMSVYIKWKGYINESTI